MRCMQQKTAQETFLRLEQQYETAAGLSSTSNVKMRKGTRETLL